MKKPRNRIAPPPARTGLPSIPNPPSPPPPANPTVLVRAVIAQWYDGRHYERGSVIPMPLSDVAPRTPSLVARL